MAAVAEEERPLDLLLVRQGSVERGGRGPFAGGGVEFGQLDPAPERPEGEVELPVLIKERGGVDGVKVVALAGAEDEALVGPAVGGVGGVEGGGGGQTDDGRIAPPRGD